VIDSRQDRAFHYAILASLALHALVLLFFPDLLDPAKRTVRFPPTIVARLLEPEPEPIAIAPPSLPAPPVPPVREEQAPRRKPVPPRVAKPAPAPRPLPAQPAPEIPVEAPPPVETPAAPVPAPAIGSVPPQPAEVPESLSRDQYRLQLIDEARRHKRYPPLARENNWQGDVLVAVVVGANGRPTVTLKGSSGYEVLDRQALEMFRQATRAVTVPPPLRGKEFALEVRAVYGLED
jgi:periplasmic protein TonB